MHQSFTDALVFLFQCLAMASYLMRYDAIYYIYSCTSTKKTGTLSRLTVGRLHKGLMDYAIGETQRRRSPVYRAESTSWLHDDTQQVPAALCRLDKLATAISRHADKKLDEQSASGVDSRQTAGSGAAKGAQ